MPDVQPFCLNGNIKSVQFGSKVEFTKMRTRGILQYKILQGGSPWSPNEIVHMSKLVTSINWPPY